MTTETKTLNIIIMKSHDKRQQVEALVNSFIQAGKLAAPAPTNSMLHYEASLPTDC